MLVMARSRKQPNPEVLRLIQDGKYQKHIGIVKELPEPKEVRAFLEEKLQITNKSERRLILVEEVDKYRVFIEITQEAKKSDYDFIVWRYSPAVQPIVKKPSHNDLADTFLKLKTKDQSIEEYLINASFRLLRDRMSVENVMKRYFIGLSEELRKDLQKFLYTLKWIGLQEDANYPPPKLGSKMTLAVLALIEVGFKPNDIRRIIRF